jgi:hypothetical protein
LPSIVRCIGFVMTVVIGRLGGLFHLETGEHQDLHEKDFSACHALEAGGLRV